MKQAKIGQSKLLHFLASSYIKIPIFLSILQANNMFKKTKHDAFTHKFKKQQQIDNIEKTISSYTLKKPSPPLAICMLKKKSPNATYSIF